MKRPLLQVSLLMVALACNAASPWFDAIKAGDTAAITKLLDAGANLEATNEWGGTGLAEAVWNGKQEVIPLLLARGANPNVSGQYGTPLCLAIGKWDTIAIRMLLDDPRTNVNLARSDGATPFQLIPYSDSKFNPGIAETLIKRGAPINGLDRDGETPLMRCCWIGAEKCAAFLIKQGADIHLKNPDGETPYVIAAQRGQIEIMKLLEKHGGKVPVLLRRSSQAKSKLTPPQLWALATGAILNQRNGASHEELVPATISSQDSASTMRLLKDEWGINNQAELVRTLASLEGSQNNPEDLAWDLCRYANVAQWGVQAGYLNEAAAWEGMLRVSRRIQGTYKSWADMAESYLTGRSRWYRGGNSAYLRDAEKAQARVEFVVQLLLNAEDFNSPWTKNKWNTDLGASGTTPMAPPSVRPEPVATQPTPVAITDGKWNSTQANCVLKIPPGDEWKVVVSEPMRLSLRSGDTGSFHITCAESRIPEVTPVMAASAKATSKARNQASGNRSETVSGDWLTFHGARAYQWVEKQWPPNNKPAYFRAQLMFIRQGRSYVVQASTATSDPFNDPRMVPLLSALRFLDEQ